MRLKLISFKIKNKKFDLKVYRCNFFERFTGLMFTRKEKAKALLFEFPKSVKMPIHSCFVFFPFIGIWLDEKNKIVKIEKVYPWRFHVLPKTKFKKLIEIPCSKEYNEILKSLDEN
jgi:uncharacterized membrane protein (UPF0127 family)